MRRLGRTLRQRQPSQAKTIAQKVAAILRKYGTDAHVYLPGIGVINGLTAGNYLDSAGTTAATVDNPVGLVLDAANSALGSELYPQPDFNAATGLVLTQPTSGSTTVSGGVARINSIDATNASIGTSANLGTVAGKLYKYTINVVSSTGSGVRFDAGGVVGIVTLNSSGIKTGYFTATANAGANLARAGATDTSIDSLSIKEVTGIHALQATTANKPILRYASGKYSWQFDGTDDYLSGSSRLFNVIDNHVIVAGVTNTKPSGTSSVFSEGNTAAAESFYNLRVLSNAVAVGVRANDGVTLVTTATVPLSLSETGVIAVNGTGGTIKIRKNGGTWTAGAVAPSPVTLNSFGIGVLFRANGASNADYFQGSIYPIIVIKSTVTDTELLTLEKFVGMLSGVTI